MTPKCTDAITDRLVPHMTRSTLLDSDAVLRLLAPRRRRELLRHLRDNRDDVVPLATLAGAVQRRCPEAGTRSDLETQLHHSDLPALDNAGVLEYDPAARGVVYHGREDIEALLETLDTQFS